MWTKICGITRPEDAVSAWQSGVSAIGLNFFRGSKRCVTPAQAAMIIAELRRAIAQSDCDSLQPPDIVGVFVNADCEEIKATVHAAGLTAVQCHGDETVKMLAQLQQCLPETALIRAFRVSEDRMIQVSEYIRELLAVIPLSALLLDAFVPGEFGGTGTLVSPDLVRALRLSTEVPIILAGGLTADNVGHAIVAADPWGVDTASGVETSPGIKNPDLMAEFIAASGAGHRCVTRLKPPADRTA